MEVICPNNNVFEIEDSILLAAQMVSVGNQEHYNSEGYELTLCLSELETPSRSSGTKWFRSFETVQEILLGFDVNATIPPIEITTRDLTGSHNYKVKDGFHRYWLSHLVGFKKVPATINNFKMSDLDSGL